MRTSVNELAKQFNNLDICGDIIANIKTTIYLYRNFNKVSKKVVQHHLHINRERYVYYSKTLPTELLEQNNLQQRLNNFLVFCGIPDKDLLEIMIYIDVSIFFPDTFKSLFTHNFENLDVSLNCLKKLMDKKPVPTC
jgi:hypothetical protein